MTDRPFVCPFCPLHCDDLSVKELAGRCELFARRFAAVQRDSADDDAYERSLAIAGQWVSQAKTIVVTGTIVDLETARAVCDFVTQTNASLHVGSKASDGYSEAFSRDGMFSITLGDAASPHQHVVMIGDCGKRLPRLKERLSGARTVYLWQSTENLVDRLARLRLVLKRPDIAQLGEDADLLYTLKLCQKESAVVFVVNVGELLDGDQRPFWSTMQGLLSELNRRIRASVLRFEDSMTLRSVAAWTSDGPHPSATAIQVPADLEICFLPWLPDDSAAAHALPPVQRRITIGCVDAQAGYAIPADGVPESVCFTAAMPGIDSKGIVIRGDGSVTLPLCPTKDNDLPTGSTTLARILASSRG